MDLQTRNSLGCGPLSPRYDQALLFAAAQHRGQLRKGSRIPYLSHLMSVSSLVLEHGGSEQAGIAGLLHDAVEDAPQGDGPAVLAEIRARFGDDVADTVASCSDGLDDQGNRSGDWATRKLPYVQKLTTKTFQAALVTAADKTHNARAIAGDIELCGPTFLGLFNACPHQLVWYYQEVRDRLAGPLGNSTIGRPLHHAVDALVRAIGVEPVPAGDIPPPCGCPSRPAKQS